jgi:hypothetical protein
MTAKLYHSIPLIQLDVYLARLEAPRYLKCHPERRPHGIASYILSSGAAAKDRLDVWFTGTSIITGAKLAVHELSVPTNFRKITLSLLGSNSPIKGSMYPPSNLAIWLEPVAHTCKARETREKRHSHASLPIGDIFARVQEPSTNNAFEEGIGVLIVQARNRR